MFVKAAPGLKVPREDKPREYITEDKGVEVPATAYYTRRLAEGDLIAEAAPVTETAAPAKSKKE